MADFVHISRLRDHPANVRHELGDLTELADSIRAQGIIQPLVVHPHPTEPGAYEVIAGHRRLAAARAAGLDEIPVTVRQRPRSGSSAAAVEMMLVENCQRRDLGPVEKAEAMGALRSHGIRAAEIARRTGLSAATVGYYLSLLDLDEDARKQVRDGSIPVGVAVSAVRDFRAKQRKRQGKRKMGGPAWEPDHLTAAHPLARKANTLCEAREHTMRRRLGKVACGQCWETAIRQDEQVAVRALRAVGQVSGHG